MEKPVPGPPAWYDWNGIRWYRNNPGYYLGIGGDGRRLHIAIWEDANRRPLPEGLIVHHVDHDKANNDPGNLMATTRADHNRHHQKGAVRDATARARIKAGVEQSWAVREERTLTCERCGAEFTTRSTRPQVRFCSKRCQNQTRRERSSGLETWEPVTAWCEGCGHDFKPKDRRTRFCSAKCREDFYSRARAAGRPRGRVRPDG